MKVILMKDVPGLGRRYDIKEVKDGYALNRLFPDKLAQPATKEAIEWLETQKEAIALQAEDNLKEIQSLVTAIDGSEVELEVKVGNKGQLFESITSNKIANKIKEMGHDISRNQIILEKPIKETGEFPVKIKFDHNLEAEINLIVVEKYD